ncbi:hypothetical protein PUN28_016618 [Cardiocondyla obscurior]|uniref:Uncharacterized protein n=1 Tax=Cardiocondyla obscurior TaxID=286306 RepID=A0AAW2ETS7_9HYME
MQRNDMKGLIRVCDHSISRKKIYSYVTIVNSEFSLLRDCLSISFCLIVGARRSESRNFISRTAKSANASLGSLHSYNLFKAGSKNAFNQFFFQSVSAFNINFNVSYLLSTEIAPPMQDASRACSSSQMGRVEPSFRARDTRERTPVKKKIVKKRPHIFRNSRSD